jgi:glutamine amidotransferase
MCRFVAYYATQPIRAAGLLADDRNALLAQSCRDLRGESHGDGWGVGWYEGDLHPFIGPKLVRSEKAAVDDPLYRETVAQIVSPLAIGHVRQASVGNLSLANTHPFTVGCWLFAHNGTLQNFSLVSPTLEAEIGPELLKHRQGTTDSELIFLWLLAGLTKLGAEPDRPIRESAAFVPFFCDALTRLADLSEKTHPIEKSKFNFLLTDGATLVATRWNHSLHWLEDPGTRRVPAKVVVASEPIGEGAWREVQEQSILLIDERFHVEHVPV